VRRRSLVGLGLVRFGFGFGWCQGIQELQRLLGLDGPRWTDVGFCRRLGDDLRRRGSHDLRLDR